MLLTKEKTHPRIISIIEYFKYDSLFYLTTIFIFIKSILFLGVIAHDSVSGINMFKAFFAPPPLAAYLAFITIFLSFAYLFNGRTHGWVLFLVNVAITILLIADLWYYRGFGNFISPYIFQQTSNLDNLTDSIASMARPIDIIFWIDILYMPYKLNKNKSVFKNYRRNIMSFLWIMLISIISIYYIHYNIDVKKTGKEGQYFFYTCWAPNQTMSNLSPIGYHIYDAYNYYHEVRNPFTLSDKENDKIKAWYKDNKENLPDNQYKGIFKGKNVIFLQVESLENFVINKKINGQEVTPNLNKILNNSYYFSNFHEQVYNGTSVDSDLMANTSVHPVRKGATFFRFPQNTYNSLPKLLKEEGYYTQAIHPDKASFWNWKNGLTAVGFDKCIDSSYFNVDETIGLGISDGSYLKQTIPLIKNAKKPFYTFMVTLSSHAPFDIPAEYRELKIDKSLDETKLGGYFQSIHYTDKHIGIFMDNLKKEGLLEDTVVVIYGDHGGIHKYYESELQDIKPQEDWWMKNNWEIPLIIYNKDISHKEFTVNGGQIDTMPTVAYMMGIDKGKFENTAMGRILVNTNKDFTVLSDRTYIGDKSNKSQVDHSILGIDISDMMIRSNYFNK
ncbi:LTA synthase family protein [Clostridium peptidivorans]|uniref:LTA synthase family protein n=1 Tax=Clostridium peptidivorans TaxID=100174 RepID=UPI001FA82BDF|nr:LTA synthase family protein [Clostridium peptidivorans]